MPILNKTMTVGFALALGLGVAACSPDVGSPEWCEQMKEKPKGDWTTNEATEYAKNCVM